MNISNYFENIKEEIIKEIFEKVDNFYEVFNLIHKFIDEETNKQLVTNYFEDYKKDTKITITDKCFIGEGTVINPGALIEGPVIIGKNVTIGHNAYIRPYTYIGDNVCIGHGSEIKNSVILNNAKVASLSFVGDSILGSEARIGSGAILSNRRFDQKEIKQGDIKTNLCYLGSVIGDEARVGAGCVISPGLLIGQKTWIDSGITLKKDISSRKLVKNKNMNIESAEKKDVEIK